jgi:hypothetical protein
MKQYHDKHVNSQTYITLHSITNQETEILLLVQPRLHDFLNSTLLTSLQVYSYDFSPQPYEATCLVAAQFQATSDLAHPSY